MSIRSHYCRSATVNRKYQVFNRTGTVLAGRGRGILPVHCDRPVGVLFCRERGTDPAEGMD